MPADFNGIAPFYNLLSKLVFGNSLLKSQLALIPFIPNYATVLIIGGGSGEFLKLLLKQKLLSKIVYIEASARMLALARKQAQSVNHQALMDWRLGTEESIRADECFDVVVSPFILDLFTTHTARKMIETISTALPQNGIWLYADFEWQTQDSGKWWKKPLVAAMYIFFRWTCHIEGTELPPLPALFAAIKWQCVYQTGFYNKLIRARVYRQLPL